MSAVTIPSASSVASVVFVSLALVIDRETNIIYSNGGKLLIGLISDTHIAFPNEKLPPQIKDAFPGVDLILHAGDIWIPSVLDELESIAPVMAAWGDDDMPADLGGDSRMLKGYSLILEGVTLWITHVKPRFALLDPDKELYNAQPVGPKEPPGVVVYGHTHFAKIEHYDGTLLVNPGSATVPNYVPKLGTVALLTIESGEAEARLVPLG